MKVNEELKRGRKIQKKAKNNCRNPCNPRAFLVLYQGISHGSGLSPMWLRRRGLVEGLRLPEENNKNLEEIKCQ